MKVPRLGKRKKRYCVVLLGLYLVMSSMYILFTRQSKITEYLSFTSRRDANNIAVRELFKNQEKSFADLPVFNLSNIINESKFIYNHSKDYSKPCFSPYSIPIDEQLEERLNRKNMMQYFNIGDQKLVSVPKWQKALNTPRPSKKPKYFIAAIVRVRLYAEDKAKWTIQELKQWLHYQFWAGTEHVYICYHFLNESEKFEHHLTEYIKHGLVSMYSWANITAIPNTKTYDKDNTVNQVSCYNHILKHHKEEAVWHYNFDMDENPYVPKDSCEGFLTRYLEKVDPNISLLRLANFAFEGQGDRSRDVFYDRINRKTPQPLNGNVKPIYRVSMTLSAGMHSSQTTGKGVYPAHHDLIMLHYWGARRQKFMNDTQELYKNTIECNDVRNTIAVNVRHSLISFGDFDAFSTKTGP